MQQIDVFDINMERIGALQTWISMVWREEYNGAGKFQVEVQRTDAGVRLLQRWHYCGLRGRDTVMVIQSVQVTDDRIIANGATALWILSKRISTEVVKDTNAELAMRSLVGGMSPWPCIELGETAWLEDKYPNQASDDTVLEYLKKIGTAVDMGFRIRRDGKRLLFECYKPTLNANARYSDQYGNIAEPSYTVSDIDTANVAVVAGAGEGEARITVTAGATDAEGADRLETYLDARNYQLGENETEDEYRERLKRHGEQQLVKLARIETVKFDVHDDRAKLGDLIQVELSAVNLRIRVRVTSEEIVSQRNQTKRSIGVGTPVLI